MFLLEGAYFVSFCSLYAYTVTILLDYGYTEVQCGYITMLQYLVMMIAGPIYGRLIDRSISPQMVVHYTGGGRNDRHTAAALLFWPRLSLDDALLQLDLGAGLLCFQCF